MKSPLVVVADYGMGNVLSVRRALEHCGATVVLTDRPEMIATADRLVLPGVGAFADCMRAIETRGLIEPIKAFVASGQPFLGICVGMQILLDEGDEFGGGKGFGLIPGRVEMISMVDEDGHRRKVPHIGWSALQSPIGANADRWSGSIFADVTPGTAVYFVHSFAARPANDAHLLAVAEHDGARVTAAVQRDNIVGTQFHPEKSGPEGLRILTRFIRI